MDIKDCIIFLEKKGYTIYNYEKISNYKERIGMLKNNKTIITSIIKKTDQGIILESNTLKIHNEENLSRDEIEKLIYDFSNHISKRYNLNLMAFFDVNDNKIDTFLNSGFSIKKIDKEIYTLIFDY